MFTWLLWSPHGLWVALQAAQGVPVVPKALLDSRLLAESALGAVGVVSWFTIRKSLSTAEELRGLRSLLIGEDQAPGILPRIEEQLRTVTNLSQAQLTKVELVMQDVGHNTARLDALEQRKPMKGQRTHE